jgi:hypothetical protein
MNQSKDWEPLPTLTLEAQELSKIKASEYCASYLAIQCNTLLSTDKTVRKAILLQAYNAKALRKKAYAKNCIHQCLLLDYC